MAGGSLFLLLLLCYYEFCIFLANSVRLKCEWIQRDVTRPNVVVVVSTTIAYSITNLSVGSLTADNSRNPSQGGCAINQRNYLVEQVSQSVEYPNEVTASVISVGRVCGFERTLAVISPVPRITILDIPRTTAQQNNFARD